jgi:hypothetical protein
VIGEPIYGSRELVYAFLEFKRKGISWSMVANRAGVGREAVYAAMRKGWFTVKLRTKLSWIVKGIRDGNILVRKSGGAGFPGQQLVPGQAWAEQLPRKRRVDLCVCGRYERCPCGCFKPQTMRHKEVGCEYLRTGAAIQNAVASMTQARQIPAARLAAALENSGFPQRLPFARSPRKSTAT